MPLQNFSNANKMSVQTIVHSVRTQNNDGQKAIVKMNIGAWNGPVLFELDMINNSYTLLPDHYVNYTNGTPSSQLSANALIQWSNNTVTNDHTTWPKNNIKIEIELTSATEGRLKIYHNTGGAEPNVIPQPHPAVVDAPFTHTYGAVFDGDYHVYMDAGDGVKVKENNEEAEFGAPFWSVSQTAYPGQGMNTQPSLLGPNDSVFGIYPDVGLYNNGPEFVSSAPAPPAGLAEKSKAINVWNDAEEKKMKMKYNAEGDFEIAVDDDKSVHIKKIKYGDAKQDLEGKINEIVASVSAEVALRSGQKSDRDTQISTLQTSLQAGIDAEEDRATLKENLLQSNIDDETGFRTTADTHLQNQINAHLSQANTNNANRLNQIIDLSNNLDAEKVRAISSEVDLAADISTEASTARAAEQANASAVATEKTRAEAAEAVNAAAISALINTSASGTGLAAEVLRATNAEAALAADISANYSSIHAILGSSPESLNSLQELVADYQANGQTVTTLVNDLSGNAMGEIASLKTQMAAVQATLLALQAP